MPSNPTSLASARQVSRGVSPPSSGMSSLDQPMGLAPMRIGMNGSVVSVNVRRRLMSEWSEPRSRGAVTTHYSLFALFSLPDALQFARLDVIGARFLNLGACRDLGHGDVPPMTAS